MKKTKVTIRKATIKDIGWMYRLWLNSSREHERYSPLDKLLPEDQIKNHIWRDLDAYLSDRNNIIIVAMLQLSKCASVQVGYACGHVGERDEPVFELSKEGFIDDICVSFDQRGKGFGKLLMDELIRKLYGRGADFIGLAVAAGNPAVEFYRKHGFEVKSYWLARRGDPKQKRLTKKK